MVSFIEMNNKFNTTVTLCNLGASIYDIKTLDKNGKLESILYTTESEADFLNDGSYLGKTIGRTGGRISNWPITMLIYYYRICGMVISRALCVRSVRSWMIVSV